MNVILIAVIVLGLVGLISALVLWATAKKFAVKEDPRLGEVTEALPGANCGGCGFPGCGGMAAACVKSADEKGSIEGLFCPVGGQPTMSKVAEILGMAAAAQAAPKVAVVRCNGTCENRPRLVEYDGVATCRVANSTCMGETACAYGCLGCGDCVAACQFDAIHMNPETGLPEVDTEKCTACGACAKACPRNIIEIREMKGKKKMGVVVECMNKDKGAVAMKACKVACIACQKCVKACEFDAVHVENNLAYIDPEKCKLCRKCEEACPKEVIHAINMPPRKPKAEVAPAAAKPAATAAATAKPAAAPAKPAEKPVATVEKPAAPAEKPAEKPAAPVAEAKAAETEPKVATPETPAAKPAEKKEDQA